MGQVGKPAWQCMAHTVGHGSRVNAEEVGVCHGASGAGACRVGTTGGNVLVGEPCAARKVVTGLGVCSVGKVCGRCGNIHGTRTQKVGIMGMCFVLGEMGRAQQCVTESYVHVMLLPFHIAANCVGWCRAEDGAIDLFSAAPCSSKHVCGVCVQNKQRRSTQCGVHGSQNVQCSQKIHPKLTRVLALYSA